MSEDEHRQMLAKSAAFLPELRARIDRTVELISATASTFHPLRLLQRAYWHYVMSNYGRIESEIERDGVLSAALLAYLQSIIVGSPPAAVQADVVDDQAWAEMEELWSQLYEDLHQFFFSENAQIHLDGAAEDVAVQEFRYRAQTEWCFIRGQRYLTHVGDHLRDALSVHEPALKRCFGITVDQLVAGVEKLGDSLTRGADDARQKYRSLVSQGETGALEEDARSRAEEEIHAVFSGFALFDVETLTGWPRSFVDQLSQEPGADSLFLAPGKNRGWPLRVAPTHDRPFLRVDGKYYCFDFIGFADGAYRGIQRALMRVEPSYETEWKERQTEVSEKLPLRFLGELLPGSTTLRSIFYQWPRTSSAKKNWCELDGLVLYKDAVIACEVRAGAFTYTDPAEDFDAHLRSIQSLLGKPVRQLQRFREYLESAESVPLFVRNGSTYSHVMDLRVHDYSETTSLCVTLDNLTQLAAQTEFLVPLGVDTGGQEVIALSVDDLRMFRDVFANPLRFVHFLRQRRAAVSSPRLRANDELDHLGLYLEHNAYALEAESYDSDTPPMWGGYQDRLDKYYAARQLGEDPPVPEQELPPRLDEIIRVLATQDTSSCRLACFLLDQNGDARADLGSMVDRVLARQEETMTTKPVSTYGDVRLSVFVRQPGVAHKDINDERDYATGAMLYAREPNRVMLHLEYDASWRLIRADAEFLERADVADERVPSLLERGKSDAKSRFDSYVGQTGAKPGKSESCPCGSGKTYGRCHSRRSWAHPRKRSKP